jgi:hypothetical protein
VVELIVEVVLPISTEADKLAHCILLTSGGYHASITHRGWRLEAVAALSAAVLTGSNGHIKGLQEIIRIPRLCGTHSVKVVIVAIAEANAMGVARRQTQLWSCYRTARHWTGEASDGFFRTLMSNISRHSSYLRSAASFSRASQAVWPQDMLNAVPYHKHVQNEPVENGY